VGKLVYLAATGALMLATAACSSSPPSSSPSTAAAPVVTFDYQGGQPRACMIHQQKQPTPGYRAGNTQSGALELELSMLAYYTANGNKAYCDARPPTATDRAWITLYVQDGAEPSHVARYLH